MQLLKFAGPALLDWTVGFVKAVNRKVSKTEETIDAVVAVTG